VIFFKSIISVRATVVITCPDGQKKLRMPLKKVTLLYSFLYKVIPSLVWKRRRRVYTEQYTRTVIHLREDVTALRALLFTICNNGGADMVNCCSDETTGSTSEVRIPAGVRNFSRLPNDRAGCAVRPTFCSTRTGSFYG